MRGNEKFCGVFYKKLMVMNFEQEELTPVEKLLIAESGSAKLHYDKWTEQHYFQAVGKAFAKNGLRAFIRPNF